MIVDLFLHLLVPLTVIFDLLDSAVERWLKFFDPLFEFLHQLTLNTLSFIILRYQHAYLIRYRWLASLFRTLFFCCWFRKCDSVSQDHCLLARDDLCYLYQRIIVHTCVVVLNSYLIIENDSLWCRNVLILYSSLAVKVYWLMIHPQKVLLWLGQFNLTRLLVHFLTSNEIIMK